MLHSHSNSTFVPEWQSQLHLNTYSRTHHRHSPRTSEDTESHRNSMFDSFKSSFRRKNSARSTSSRESVDETPRPVSSFRTPVELSTASLSLNATQPGRERSPLTNPSPATRRPGRFSHSRMSQLWDKANTSFHRSPRHERLHCALK
jgi:hypothetical protein